MLVALSRLLCSCVNTFNPGWCTRTFDNSALHTGSALLTGSQQSESLLAAQAWMLMSPCALQAHMAAHKLGSQGIDVQRCMLLAFPALPLLTGPAPPQPVHSAGPRPTESPSSAAAPAGRQAAGGPAAAAPAGKQAQGSSSAAASSGKQAVGPPAASTPAAKQAGGGSAAPYHPPPRLSDRPSQPLRRQAHQQVAGLKLCLLCQPPQRSTPGWRCFFLLCGCSSAGLIRQVRHPSLRLGAVRAWCHAAARCASCLAIAAAAKFLVTQQHDCSTF